MIKFHNISTKDYTPISYHGEYYHRKYELIKSFLSETFDKNFSKILAKPVLDNGIVDWYTDSESELKRITDFNDIEKQKILKIYNLKIKRINELSASFLSSRSMDKQKWADLIKNVFNSNNNIVFSDGKDEIVILWGWQFNSFKENEIKIEEEEIKTTNLQNEIDIEKIPVIDEKEIINKNSKKKKLWYLSFFDNLEKVLKFLMWILIILFIFWLISQLKHCNYENKSRPQDSSNSKSYEPTLEKQDNSNTIIENNSGLDLVEFEQVSKDNFQEDLYEYLLIDRDGNQRLLPLKEKVHIPIVEDKIIVNQNKETIISDRINIYLKNKNKNLENFASDFKKEFPSSKYQIVYRDNNLRRVQVRVPENERENIKSLLKSSFSNYDLLIWDESIFSSGNFNDPALNDKKTNHYFKSIKVEEAWKKTTGDSSIIVAIIDDGFDLNHIELRDNVVKPYNILNQNNLVYADENLSHGTHVAGLAIANKNNKIGACGIAPDCSFMPIQIGGHSSDFFSNSSIIDGILYAINNGADIINLSIQSIYDPIAKNITENDLKNILDSYSRDDELFYKELFAIANDSNVTIVFCAGNLEVLVGLDAMKRDSSIITVSAVNQFNEKATFTNYGKQSTVSAPGVNIYSCLPNNNFGFADGTSMSSPIVAGVVALMKSVNPKLTNYEIKNILRKTGKNIDETIGPLVQVNDAILLSYENSNNHIDNSSFYKDSILNEIKRHENKIKELRKVLNNY